MQAPTKVFFIKMIGFVYPIFLQIPNASLFHVFFIFEVFFFCSCILILLVFGHKVVHVGLSFSELHLVHTFSGVPVEEGLSSEHRCELFSNALEHLLDGSGVSEEGDRHLQSLWWDVAHGGFDVVRDPFDEVGAVLVLDVEHLLVDFLGGHASSEHCGCGEVAAVARIRGAHHVLGVKHLLGELWDSEGAVLLASSGCEWCESSHEEVKTWEWDEVDSKLSEIRVELTRESKATSDTRHSCGDEVVQVAVSWGGELQGSEANVVQGFVVNDHDFVGVLHELMDGEGGVVRLNDGVGNLWRWEDGEGAHHSVWVLLADLGDEEGSHA